MHCNVPAVGLAMKLDILVTAKSYEKRTSEKPFYCEVEDIPVVCKLDTIRFLRMEYQTSLILESKDAKFHRKGLTTLRKPKAAKSFVFSVNMRSIPCSLAVTAIA